MPDYPTFSGSLLNLEFLTGPGSFVDTHPLM